MEGVISLKILGIILSFLTLIGLFLILFITNWFQSEVLKIVVILILVIAFAILLTIVARRAKE